jgi:hypothetical protein
MEGGRLPIFESDYSAGNACRDFVFWINYSPHQRSRDSLRKNLIRKSKKRLAEAGRAPHDPVETG